MNIYSLDFFKENNDIKGVYYLIRRDRHSESLYVEIKGGTKDRRETRYYFSHNDPLSSSWMKALDYDMPGADKSTEVFLKLSKTCDLLPINDMSPQSIPRFLSGLTEESFYAITKEILSLLKEVIEQRVAFCYIYPMYYRALQGIRDFASGATTDEMRYKLLIGDLLDIKREFENIESNYQSARDYCDAVFITGNSPDTGIGSDKIAQIYRGYCRRNGLIDYTEDFLHNSDHQISALPTMGLDWREYLEVHKEEYLTYELKQETLFMFSLSELFHTGVDLMLESQAVLRKCKLCGGYFRIKYSSSQEYCTRLYRDTKAACNEYVSRKSYKEKLFQNPIHQEFTKSYNKLYGRIRRGKLPADTPLMDQLKALHDEYAEKYENTHHKDREAVWKEYIEKNRKLLS